MMLVLNLICNRGVARSTTDGGERGKFVANLALDVSPRIM